MHDPLHCINQLRQVLAADKLAVGFFLGAGCPCAIRVPTKQGDGDEPLVPAIEGLTKKVSDSLCKHDGLSTAFSRLKRTFTDDGRNKPNVEHMLSRIRILREAAGTKSARGISARHLDALDEQICRIISSVADKELPDMSTPYHAMARMARGYRNPPLQIFTTNYDLLAEQALESLHVPVFDGFVGSARPFFDQRATEDEQLPERWARVWKLHGSINWRFKKETNQILRTRITSDGDELLIHPSHRKYDESRRMPYIVMIDRLRSFLRNNGRPVALVVLGHSFSDEHLNATVVESLRANPSAACYALQYRCLAEYSTANRLAMTEPNLTILARDGAVIRKRQSAWLQQTTAQIQELQGTFELEDGESQNSETAAGDAPAKGASDQSRPCRFLLGDFDAFGNFLENVSGSGPTIASCD